MMQPPADPFVDAMATDDATANEATQQTQQSTQPSSQDVNWTMESHLWGFLLPCSPAMQRIDFARVKPTYKLGRNADQRAKLNDIFLPGMKISNAHCEISWDGREDKSSVVKVVDLSSNGTFINGEKVGKGRFAVLKEGNEIAFGTPQPQPHNSAEDYRYIYRHLAAGPPPEASLHAHYDLTEELGKGSFATVMKAMSKATGQYYAVKMIQSSKIRGGEHTAAAVSGNPGATMQSFIREISILEKINHPNICQLKEVFVEDANINLVLEWVAGGDLLDYILDKDGLPEPLSQHFTYQMCNAMAYIHAKGITHRDLKPENILLTDDHPPNVKVADFGLAKAVDSLTMLRTMCGTPSYLAPEVVLQTNNQGYQQVVDSWSIGVIVFSMLTNTSPFIEPSEPQDIRVKITQRVIDWTTLSRAGVSEECQDFIRRLLEVNPQRRMSLTAALQHPWLVDYKSGNDVANGQDKRRTAMNAAGGVDGDASMRSVQGMDSMMSDDPSQSQGNGHVPGSYSQQDRPIRRRRDIILDQDNLEPALEPSQEMLQIAQEENDRFMAEHVPAPPPQVDRPNKRKSSPLDFEASLTPMPEEDEDEDAPNGRSVDMGLADPEPLQNAVVNARPKRARASPAVASPGRAKPPKGRTAATGTTMKARGRAPVNRNQADPEDDSPKVRRSTRLSGQSKAGRR